MKQDTKHHSVAVAIAAAAAIGMFLLLSAGRKPVDLDSLAAELEQPGFVLFLDDGRTVLRADIAPDDTPHASCYLDTEGPGALQGYRVTFRHGDLLVEGTSSHLLLQTLPSGEVSMDFRPGICDGNILAEGRFDATGLLIGTVSYASFGGSESRGEIALRLTPAP